ncbi:hypothetical protein [Spongiactinospora sp. TRM90649]|uniref:hypothetical protein n=1 Tax=Spongiactinospora sp. TRM90649 TaxID=3031114 RepID=UPI0023F85E6A|nr:hypothetical protein [Spongiactinospora sp. TRM90649]MDF5756628.1 hypothetical protein [Spongiactinospora sp. TRM90649]
MVDVKGARACVFFPGDSQIACWIAGEWKHGWPSGRSIAFPNREGIFQHLLSAQPFSDAGKNLSIAIPIGESVAVVPSDRARPASWLTELAAVVAAEQDAGEAWRRDLIELASTAPRREVIQYALGLVWAGVRSRAAWCTRRAAAPLRLFLCWTLRSQARTWTPLFAILLWGGLETVWDTGLGAAIVLVLTAGFGFYALVEWARERFGVQVGSRERAKASDGDDSL